MSFPCPKTRGGPTLTRPLFLLVTKCHLRTEIKIEFNDLYIVWVLIRI